MTGAIDPSMGSLKEFVESLIDEFGGVRKAAKVLGIKHQKLLYYMNKGEKMQEFLDLLETARTTSKLSKSAIWDKVISAKKEK